MRAAILLLSWWVLLAPLAQGGEAAVAPEPKPEPFQAKDGAYGFCTGRTREANGCLPYDLALADGKIVIPAKYGQVGLFKDGRAFVAPQKDGPWGYIDTWGNVVVELQYRQAGYFNAGHAVVRGSNGYGMIDRDGKIEVFPVYDWVDEFVHDNRVLVQDKDGYGFCDAGRREIIGTQYCDALPFSDGMARVRKNDSWGWIDAAGKPFGFGRYEEIEDFSEGLAAFRKDGKWGYVDKQMKEVIEAKWNYAGEFHQGMAVARSKPDGKVGYIDRTGKLVIAEQYTRAASFSSSGHAVVFVGETSRADPMGVDDWEKDRHYCFIDKTGLEVFKRRFCMAYFSDFSEGRSQPVFDGEKWCHLSGNGTMKELERLRGNRMVAPNFGLEPYSEFIDTKLLDRYMALGFEDDGP